jgi:hypothetical protein
MSVESPNYERGKYPGEEYFLAEKIQPAECKASALKQKCDSVESPASVVAYSSPVQAQYFS